MKKVCIVPINSGGKRLLDRIVFVSGAINLLQESLRQGLVQGLGTDDF